MGGGTVTGSGGGVSTIPPGALLAIVLVSIVTAIIVLLLGRRNHARVEDPERITKYLANLKGLDWSAANTLESFDKARDAIIGLFEAEVQYYYRARTVRRQVAFFARAGGFGFGTLGLLCPLLATAFPTWDALTRLGYLFFAAAAACLACNELFGGTRGHIRAVNTQYKIEGLLSMFAIEWERWRASYLIALEAERRQRFEEGFSLLRSLNQQIYAVLDDETKEWGKVVVEAEAAFKASVNNRGKGVS